VTVGEHKLKKAKELERLRYMKLILKLNEDEQARIATINADMNRRGLSLSGPRLVALSDARVDKLRQCIDGRIKIRKELIAGFPELRSETSLDELLTELNTTVGYPFTNLYEPDPQDLARNVEPHDGRERGKLMDYARNEIEILKKEIALDLHRKSTAAPAVSVTTTGGPALVNLGVIYGNVQQVIGKVGQTGDVDLEGLLSQLATAIRNSEGLGNTRATYLEQVKFIAEQAAEPEGQRKTSLVTGMFLGLQVSLQNMANLAQILTLVGPALAQHFGISWPF
jgi:hypothetical protein